MRCGAVWPRYKLQGEQIDLLTPDKRMFLPDLPSSSKIRLHRIRHVLCADLPPKHSLHLIEVLINLCFPCIVPLDGQFTSQAGHMVIKAVCHDKSWSCTSPTGLHGKSAPPTSPITEKNVLHCFACDKNRVRYCRPQRPAASGTPADFTQEGGGWGLRSSWPPWQTCWIFNEILWWGCLGLRPGCPPSRYVGFLWDF